MLLINENVKPNKTIYYLAAQVYKKINNVTYSVKELYNELQVDIIDIEYSHYLYALNFLFLLEKIKIDKDVIRLC